MTTPTEIHESATAISKITEAAGDDSIARATISRGYYSAYHAAKDVHDRLLLSPPSKKAVGSHERIYLSMIECTSAHSKDLLDVKAIGLIALRTLKPFRKTADYEISTPLPPHAMGETLARAKLIIEKAGNIK